MRHVRRILIYGIVERFRINVSKMIPVPSSSHVEGSGTSGIGASTNGVKALGLGSRLISVGVGPGPSGVANVEYRSKLNSLGKIRRSSLSLNVRNTLPVRVREPMRIKFEPVAGVPKAVANGGVGTILTRSVPI